MTAAGRLLPSVTCSLSRPRASCASNNCSTFSARSSSSSRSPAQYSECASGRPRTRPDTKGSGSEPRKNCVERVSCLFGTRRRRTYRVTIRDDDAVLHIDVDVTVCNLDTVHVLPCIYVRYTRVLVRVRVLADDKRTGRRRLARQLLDEALRNLRGVTARGHKCGRHVDMLRAVDCMGVYRAEAECLTTTNRAVVGVATGVSKYAGETECSDRSDE